MIVRFLLWLSRVWHEYRESRQPGIKPRQGWSYNKKGDTRRDI